jgi:hypothetical protein
MFNICCNFFVWSFFLCMIFYVHRLVIIGICTIIAPTQPVCMFRIHQHLANKCSTSTTAFVCEIYFFMHDFSCVRDACCSWILCNYYTNITYVCVLEVIDILLANVQHCCSFFVWSLQFGLWTLMNIHSKNEPCCAFAIQVCFWTFSSNFSVFY